MKQYLLQPVEMCENIEANRIVVQADDCNWGFELNREQMSFLQNGSIKKIFAFVKNNDLSCKLLALLNCETGEFLVEKNGVTRKFDIEELLSKLHEI